MYTISTTKRVAYNETVNSTSYATFIAPDRTTLKQTFSFADVPAILPTLSNANQFLVN
jgi:hypothetical protein